VRLTLGFHLEHVSDIHVQYLRRAYNVTKGILYNGTYEIIEEKKEPCPTGPATEMLQIS
jgi:hypothetical protein